MNFDPYYIGEMKEKYFEKTSKISFFTYCHDKRIIPRKEEVIRTGLINIYYMTSRDIAI